MPLEDWIKLFHFNPPLRLNATTFYASLLIGRALMQQKYSEKQITMQNIGIPLCLWLIAHKYNTLFYLFYYLLLLIYELFWAIFSLIYILFFRLLGFIEMLFGFTIRVHP